MVYFCEDPERQLLVNAGLKLSTRLYRCGRVALISTALHLTSVSSGSQCSSCLYLDLYHIYISIVLGVYRWDLHLRLFLVFSAGSSLLLAWPGRLWQRPEVGDVA